MVINKDPQATLLRYLRASKGSPQHAADKIQGGAARGFGGWAGTDACERAACWSRCRVLAAGGLGGAGGCNRHWRAHAAGGLADPCNLPALCAASQAWRDQHGINRILSRPISSRRLEAISRLQPSAHTGFDLQVSRPPGMGLARWRRLAADRRLALKPATELAGVVTRCCRQPQGRPVLVHYLGALDLSGLQRHVLKEDDLVKYHLHTMEVRRLAAGGGAAGRQALLVRCCRWVRAGSTSRAGWLQACRRWLPGNQGPACTCKAAQRQR